MDFLKYKWEAQDVIIEVQETNASISLAGLAMYNELVSLTQNICSLYLFGP